MTGHRIIAGDTFADDLAELVARARSNPLPPRPPRRSPTWDPTPPRLDLRDVARCSSCGMWRTSHQCTTCDETGSQTHAARRTVYDDKAVS